MDEKKLARIHRVRTLQLTLVRADEAAAQARVASESALSSRIAHLAANVAPVPQASAGMTLVAAAHFRERLNQSAAAAAARVHTAQGEATRAADATRAAMRDESAVEKLVARARAAGMVREMRALEDTPSAPRKRHDPC